MRRCGSAASCAPPSRARRGREARRGALVAQKNAIRRAQFRRVRKLPMNPSSTVEVARWFVPIGTRECSRLASATGWLSIKNRPRPEWGGRERPTAPPRTSRSPRWGEDISRARTQGLEVDFQRLSPRIESCPQSARCGTQEHEGPVTEQISTWTRPSHPRED